MSDLGDIGMTIGPSAAPKCSEPQRTWESGGSYMKKAQRPWSTEPPVRWSHLVSPGTKRHQDNLDSVGPCSPWPLLARAPLQEQVGWQPRSGGPTPSPRPHTHQDQLEGGAPAAPIFRRKTRVKHTNPGVRTGPEQHDTL